jgi:hypothetical protein
MTTTYQHGDPFWERSSPKSRGMPALGNALETRVGGEKWRRADDGWTKRSLTPKAAYVNDAPGQTKRTSPMSYAGVGQAFQAVSRADFGELSRAGEPDEQHPEFGRFTERAHARRGPGGDDTRMLAESSEISPPVHSFEPVDLAVKPVDCLLQLDVFTDELFDIGRTGSGGCFWFAADIIGWPGPIRVVCSRGR